MSIHQTRWMRLHSITWIWHIVAIQFGTFGTWKWQKKRLNFSHRHECFVRTVESEFRVLLNAYLADDMGRWWAVVSARRSGLPWLCHSFDSVTIVVRLLAVVVAAAAMVASVTMEPAVDLAKYHLVLMKHFDHTNYCWLDYNYQWSAVSSVMNYRL